MSVNKSGVDGKLIQMFQSSSSHLIKLQLRGFWWRDTKEKETGEPAGELRVEDPALFLLWREDPTAFRADYHSGTYKQHLRVTSPMISIETEYVANSLSACL